MRNFLIMLFSVLALLWVQRLARAGEPHPVYLAPGFDFNQVGSVCVMPLLDARQNPTPFIDLGPFRPLVMEKLQARGYDLADPGCAGVAGGSAGPQTKNRWLLTVRFDAMMAPYPLGSMLAASLYDTEAQKEVWKDTARTGFGGRYKAALTLNMGGAVAVDGLIASAIGPVLATFEKRGKHSANASTHAEPWAPLSVRAVMSKSRTFCRGSLQLASGVLKFDPDDKNREKCTNFQLSAAASEIKVSNFGIHYRISIRGKGSYIVYGANGPRPGYTPADDAQIRYLFLALAQGR